MKAYSNKPNSSPYVKAIRLVCRTIHSDKSVGKLEKNSDASTSVAKSIDKLQNVYTSIKNAPKYPENFRAIQNRTKKSTVDNKLLLEELRKIESGKWKKVFKAGYVNGEKVSIHYFESASGKVFDVDIRVGWRNL